MKTTYAVFWYLSLLIINNDDITEHINKHQKDAIKSEIWRTGSPTTIQLIAAKNPLKSQVLVVFFVILSPSCWHYRYRFFLFTNLWTILLYNWHKFIRFLHFLLLHLHRVRKRCVFDGWSYNLLNVVQSWKRTMKFAMLSIPMMWKATIRKAFAAISL